MKTNTHLRTIEQKLVKLSDTRPSLQEKEGENVNVFPPEFKPKTSLVKNV